MEHLPESWPYPDPPRILIAAPDAELRSKIATCLDQYTALEANDNRRAAALLESEQVDAVVASAVTPDGDGIELCRHLVREPDSPGVPVALVVADDEEHIAKAVDAGASEVVTFPFAPTELRLRLRKMLEAHEARREISRKNHVIGEALKDLRESEGMLVQADKLSLLGEMTAGIVHEINNPLNFSKSALFILNRTVDDLEEEEIREEFKELVGDVTEGLDMVGHIVKDLRAFASKGTREMTEIDIRQVVRTATRLIANRLTNITYREELPEALMTWGNENSLCQVVLNLIKNGVEATEAAGRDLEQSEIRVTGKQTEDGVLLRVRDNGCGISKNDRETMFEPFFTTKGSGRGMGLGLSICRRILDDHGASIAVDSNPGEYTEFTLFFPPPSREENRVEIAGGADSIMPMTTIDY